jgi:hypothetical protein
LVNVLPEIVEDVPFKHDITWFMHEALAHFLIKVTQHINQVDRLRWAHPIGLTLIIPQSNGLSFVGVFKIISLLNTSVDDVKELQCV